MQTQNIQLSEILDTIEEMGDLSESAMEAARARQIGGHFHTACWHHR